MILVKSLFFILILSNSLIALEYKLKLGLEGINYKKNPSEILTYGNADISDKNKNFTTNAQVEFLYSSEYKEKRYLLLNELYITREFDDYLLSIGKKIKFWGELEGHNVADIYNQKNYIKDPFDKSAKYGAIGADITRYFDDNSLEFGLKFYEENLKYPQKDRPYSPFVLNYNEKLELSNHKYTPTFYMKANLINDEYLDTETKIVFLHGYDTKRDIIINPEFSLSQYAYRVNKAILLSHIIYMDTIFKTELSYTDVLEYAPMSDYTQLSFGVEKSFYEIAKANLTLFSEYYRYIYEESGKANNVDISEVYDNDLFLALKINLNDVRSSEFKVGILKDLEKNEQIIKSEINTRVLDSFVVYAKYLHITSKEIKTILSKFDDTSRFIFGITYTY